MPRVAAAVYDVVLLTVAATIALVISTGGGEFDLSGRHVSVHSLGVPVAAATVLLLVRFRLPRVPFLGFTSIRINDIDSRVASATWRVAEASRDLSRERALRIMFVLSIAALAIKAGTAVAHPGFFSGDDVEVQEMTLGRLLHRDWPVWNLRSPFYPMLIVYPVQAIVSAAGVSDVGSLVTAGRIAVAALSTLAIPLLYVLVRRGHGVGEAMAAAVFLAVSRLHLAFGSTELPRPVAAVVVLAAFGALTPAKGPRSAVAGLLLAIAAAMRFSEAIFAAPAMIQLLWDRRVKSAVVLVATFAGGLAVIQAVSDEIYWSEPFFSARHIVEYTLVQGQSSRGFQPVWHYALRFTEWTNPVALAFAVIGARRNGRAALWVAVPILLFSLLPHKEARYLIPVNPFVAFLAGVGAWTAVRHLTRRSTGTPSQASPRWVTAAVVVTCAAALYELGSFRLARSDAEVRLARVLQTTSRSWARFAAEQAWRMGGHLYLEPAELIAVAAPTRTQELTSLASDRSLDAVALRTTTCRVLACETAFAAGGYASVPVAADSGYVLFARAR
jgi:glycosyl transferase family 22 (putative mannosyltransferase)